MRSTLLVFDIDGTLITTKAGRRAFNRAFERVFGLSEAARNVPMAGRTDPAIFRDVCAEHSLDPGTFGAWKLEFLAELADAMNEDPGRVLPGVVELVQACAAEPGFHLALGTGNVEEGARLKLAPHDLNQYFPVGGFGADGETRDEVIASGIAKAQALHDRHFDRIIILGDTPHDIGCGRANGCLTVAVTTGPYAAADLQGCQPDLLLPDFADAHRVLQLLRDL